MAMLHSDPQLLIQIQYDDGIEFLPALPLQMSEYPRSLTQPHPVETQEKNDLFESKVIASKALQYQIIML